MFSMKAGGPAPASGMEMMLKSIIGQEAMDAIKVLASSGSVEQIMKFASGLEKLNERLDRIEHHQNRILLVLGLEASSNAANCEPIGDAAGIGEPAPIEPGPARQSRARRVAGGATDSGRGAAHVNGGDHVETNSGVDQAV